MSVSVGDTFELNGSKWAIKLIDLDGTHPNNKAGKPRIDASRFYTDEFGEEKVRKGRPSKFDPQDVYGALGLDVPKILETDGFSTTTVPIDEVERSWEETRISKERVAELIGALDDDATSEDW